MRGRWWCALACAAALAGCEGGGSRWDLKITFSLNLLQFEYYDWDIPPGEPLEIPVNLHITGSTSADQTYTVFLDSAGTFEPDPELFEGGGPEIFSLVLVLPADVPPGNRFGTITGMVCSDPACDNVLTSDTMQYNINIRPNPTLTVGASGPLVGKALVREAADPRVAGFSLPLLTLQWASVPTQFRSNVHVHATDPDGRITVVGEGGNTSYKVLPGLPAGGQFQLDFSVAQDLPEGEYTGEIELQACRDAACLSQFTGSSTLAYQLSVGPGDQPALAPVAGAPEWQMSSGGNAARTAHVPMATDAAAFAPRWISRVARFAGDPGVSDNDIVTLDGKVLVRANAGVTGVYALNEADGTQAWHKDVAGVGPLLSAGGSVYLRSETPQALHALDTGGATVFEEATTVVSQDVPLTPLGGHVLAWDQTPGPASTYAFNRYDGATGALLGVPACFRTVEDLNRTGSIPQMLRTPPVAGETAYFLADTGLEIVDFGAGQSCTSVPWTFGAAGTRFSPGSLAALAPGGNVIYATCFGANDAFNSVDPSTGARAYGVSSACANPAIAGGALYTGATARSEATGQVLWTPPPGIDLQASSAIVTDNMLFVKGPRTYAIDLATHRVVWSLSPMAGTMALSPNGVLYVLHVEDGSGIPGEWALAAINVR